MTGSGPRGVLRVGDRVRFDGQVHVVAGLVGTTVRLQGESGGASLVLFSHLLVAEGFELLDSLPTAPKLPSFGLLDTVPEPALRRARLLERHTVEMETGLPPGAEPGSRPRPEYDPKWRTVHERNSLVALTLGDLTATQDSSFVMALTTENNLTADYRESLANLLS